MISRRKLTILALVVGMVGALLATAGIASGGGPFYADRGVLILDTHVRLDTNGNPGYRIDWYDAGVSVTGTPTESQFLGVDSKCNVSLRGPNLISITPTGSTFGTGIGAVSHGLGVKTKNNCSTEQGQIAVGQKLKLSLGSFFDDTFGIESAEVDVEGKRNAKLGVTYFFSDATTAPDDKPLGFTSDNGPDSGTDDNNIVTLGSASPPFRAVEFRPIATGTNSPAISIEGGGDGLGTNASVFELVQAFDGILGCGDTATTSDGFLAGSFTRLETDGVAAGCATDKPYFLDVAAADITFVPVSPTIFAIYRGDLTFSVRSPSAPQTVLRYDRDADGTAAGTVNVQACNLRAPDSSEVGLFPELGTTLFPDLTGVTDTDSQPATWCLVAINTVTQGSGGMVLDTFVVYGEGDPRFSGA